jgi:hypothetical protein
VRLLSRYPAAGHRPQGPPFIDALYRHGHHADAAFLLAARRGVRSNHWEGVE